MQHNKLTGRKRSKFILLLLKKFRVPQNKIFTLGVRWLHKLQENDGLNLRNPTGQRKK